MSFLDHFTVINIFSVILVSGNLQKPTSNRTLSSEMEEAHLRSEGHDHTEESEDSSSPEEPETQVRL